MAQSAGYLQSTKKKTTQQFDISTNERLAAFAESKGFEQEAQQVLRKPKLSFLQRLGRGLNAFEVGNALYQKRYENASFMETYIDDVGHGLKAAVTGRESRVTPKRIFKDILMKEGMKDRPGKIDAVDLMGLAADIVTDPTTWFGMPAAKLGKKGVKIVSKAGKKLPVVGKVADTASDTMGGLFKPGYRLRKSGKAGEEVWQRWAKHVKATRSEVNDFLGEAAVLAKGVKKSIGRKEYKKVGVKIGEAIEGGAKTGEKTVNEMIDYLTAFSKNKGEKLAERGIIRGELPDWMHHMLTPEAAEMVAGGRTFSALGKMTKVKKFHGRNIMGTVKEINKLSLKKDGIKLFEEDAFKAFSKSGADSISAINTFDFLKRIGRDFGEKASKDFYDDAGVKYVKSRASGLNEKALGDIRLPEPIAKHIDEIQSFMSGDESTNAFLKLYDDALRVWKGSVTGYFPAFHTRNAIGGTFNNWIAGVRNPKRYLDTEKILQGKKGIFKTDNLGDLTYDVLRQKFKEGGVVGQTGYLDVTQYLKKKVSPSGVDMAKALPQKVMGFMEDRMRGTLFIDTLKKSKKSSLDKAVSEAAKKTIKFHFDYMPEGFTHFEKTIMKRVIPFYTWTRHNIPLQLEQIIMQPGKYSGVFKTQRSWGAKPSSEEESVLPKWLKERYTIKAEGGYWSGIGLPLEEMTDKLSAPMRGFGTSMSPLIKTPIEQLTGYNIFKEKRIDDDYYGKNYKNAPGFLKDWLELKERKGKSGDIYYSVNPKRRYWLEAIGARGLNTAMRVADASDDKKNLLSLITTIRKYDYDIEDLRKWSDIDKRQELEKALQQAGELFEYKHLYVPKNYK